MITSVVWVSFILSSDSDFLSQKQKIKVPRDSGMFDLGFPMEYAVSNVISSWSYIIEIRIEYG